MTALVIPNIFLPVTTISSTAMNANFAAVAAAVVASAALDGSTTFTGSVKLADGTAAIPALSFGLDTDTGLFRKGANQLGIGIGGVELAYFDSTGLFTADLTLSDDLTVTDLATINGNLILGGTFRLQNADTILTRASAGDVNVAGNIMYRLGGTDVAIADGGTGASTAAAGYNNIKQPASDTATGAIEIADQTEMEAGADTTRAVTPGRQHFHPGHPKCWLYVTGVATPVIGGSYNITSISDNGVGELGVTIANDFSSNNWACVPSAEAGTTAGLVCSYNSKSAGSVVLLSRLNNGSSSDPASFSMVGLGDL